MRCPILRVVSSSVVVVVVVAHIVRVPFSGNPSGDKCRASLPGGVDHVRERRCSIGTIVKNPVIVMHSVAKSAEFCGMRRWQGLSCPPAGPPRMPFGSRIGITPHDRYDRPYRPGLSIGGREGGPEGTSSKRARPMCDRRGRSAETGGRGP